LFLTGIRSGRPRYTSSKSSSQRREEGASNTPGSSFSASLSLFSELSLIALLSHAFLQAVQALLVGSKSTMRAIAALLRSAGDAAGSSGRKQFTKACAGLGHLGVRSSFRFRVSSTSSSNSLLLRFEQIDSDFALDVATQVATSKKAALLGLGKKITEWITLD